MKRYILASLSIATLFISMVAPAIAQTPKPETTQLQFSNKLNPRFKEARQRNLNKLNPRFKEARRRNLNN